MEKIKGRYDVIVVGGGIAGVAASISAKINGVRNWVRGSVSC